MPKLRRLNGQQVIAILETLGFNVVRIKGSHHILKRTIDGKEQQLNVPVHGKKVLGIGMIRALYRDARQYLSEEEIKKHFYAD